MGHGVGISPGDKHPVRGGGKREGGYGVSPPQGCCCSAAAPSWRCSEPGRVRMELRVPNPGVIKGGDTNVATLVPCCFGGGG